MFNVHFDVTVDNTISDFREAKFGIREVTSELNEHGDIVFYVNRKAFQVLGAGYAPDLWLQFNSERFTKILEYTLDIGLNTIRLEGKLERPELYEIADRLGVMVLPGWECCDKWETIARWSAQDYVTADASMRHEAAMLQTHPSVLGFMVGSDEQPGDEATKVYTDALKDAGWQTPIISSGSDRGYPRLLGPSGMKMEGPYEWVPPKYWWDTKPYNRRRGAAFGFGSELGAGVGTPEVGSLLGFLSPEEREQLWRSPNDDFYHNGAGPTFMSRRVYNTALWHRHGAPTGLDDYILKAQMMDYEATRAQFEAYSAKWNSKRPATGMIYWMLNSAWPSLHWNLFDFYLRAAGSYFGAKTGSRLEHVAYDYLKKDIYLINHSIDRRGSRRIEVDLIDANGNTLSRRATTTTTEPNTSKNIRFTVHEVARHRKHGLLFMRLRLADEWNTTLSRNVYWLARNGDKLSWGRSQWYYTPVKKYADYTALQHLPQANLTVTATRQVDGNQTAPVFVTLENHSPVPAVFIRLNLVVFQSFDPIQWQQVVPVRWQDNYVTLWPYEKMEIVAEPSSGELAHYLEITGMNINITDPVEIVSDSA